MGSGASLLLRPDTLSWVPRGKLFHFPHAASSSPINGAGGSAWTSVSEDRQPSGSCVGAGSCLAFGGRGGACLPRPP